jgi:hypothetical protein
MSKIVNRIYDTYDTAVSAINALEAGGISHNDISIVANNADKRHDPTHKDAAAKGAGAGAAAGAAIGGGAGLLAGLGMLAIPGVGPVVAAGWLIATAAGAAAGAGTGAAAGGVIGKLTEHEVSEEDAHVYMETIRRGGALVSVKTSDKNRDEVEEILDRHDSIDVASRRSAYEAKKWATFDPQAPHYTQAEIESERAQYR